MLRFLIILCAISFIGLCALLWLKWWELANGRVVSVGASLRPRLREWGQWVILHTTHHVSLGIELQVRRTWSWVRAWLLEKTAHFFHYVEQMIQKVWQAVQNIQRARPHHPVAGRASGFLREVAEYKRSLANHHAKPKVGVREEVLQK